MHKWSTGLQGTELNNQNLYGILIDRFCQKCKLFEFLKSCQSGSLISPELFLCHPREILENKHNDYYNAQKMTSFQNLHRYTFVYF